METNQYENVNNGMFAAMGTGALIVCFVIWIFFIVCMWKVFTKAGKPGWASIVPIYNCIVMLEIAGKPVWWILLLLIPFVNIIIAIIMIHNISLAFGQGVGMTLLLLFIPIIGWPMLAFGSAQYSGPAKSPQPAM